MHAGGIALLITIVLGAALWISAQQNRLATKSSQRLVENEIKSVRAGTYMLVRDYSLWDEAFAAVHNDEREWLYSSIGTSVTELGTFDLAILVPDANTNFGWLAGSPPEGEADILPAPLFAALLGLLETSEESSVQTRTLLGEFDGAPWFFAVSRMTPTEGIPQGVQRGSLPIQIQGMRLAQERLAEMGRSLLTTKIALSQSVAPGQASVPLDGLQRPCHLLYRLGRSPPRGEHPSQGSHSPRARVRTSRRRSAPSARSTPCARLVGSSAPWSRRRRRIAAGPSSCRTSATNCGRP